MTLELDSESLSTLRKIIFKRDSCTVDEVAAPVIASCAKNVRVSISKKNQNLKVRKFFKKFQKTRKYLKKIQKIRKVFRKFWKVSLPLSAFRLLALA